MPRHDVIILGGGLAGLTLALHLRRRNEDIDILVLERRAHPVPHAAHKVGESSVEIGAHYFDTVLGLKPHMQQDQLRKFGFRFFFSEGRRDIDQVTELGASRFLAVPSYQIDRGIFENYLAEEAAARGIRFVDQAVVRQVGLNDDAVHTVSWTQSGQMHEAEAAWVVDASGRAGVLKHKLGLAEPNAHEVHAVWFRMGERIVLDDWSDAPAWQARCDPRARWLSTNHLCGKGYWVWLIPLASGSHSVGIVADSNIHPLHGMDTYDKAMQWIEQYQPRLHDELAGKQHLLQDFHFLRKFSYGCKKVFGENRWALTGEAGLFLDPFYSPGSDFIAIGNTFICDLIERDRAGRPMAARAQLYDQLFHSFYDSTLALYQDQYALFGDPQVMPVKVIWDYAYYWGVLSQLFFQDRLTDVAVLGELREELQHCQQLNIEVQRFLNAWSQASDKQDPGGLLDQASLPWFAALNASLNEPCADRDAFCARVRDCIGMLRTLAWQIRERALSTHARLPVAALDALLARDMPLTPVDRARDDMLFESQVLAGAI